jgi:hypothetical protein
MNEIEAKLEGLRTIALAQLGLLNSAALVLAAAAQEESNEMSAPALAAFRAFVKSTTEVTALLDQARIRGMP